MQTISYDQFAAVELRAGTITRVEEFPQARKPAYKIWADFGPEFGIKQSSVQITAHYKPESLIGR
jgi:tRNA-binding protein